PGLDTHRFTASIVDQHPDDQEAVRFTIRLQTGRPVEGMTFGVVAYLPKDELHPQVLWGSMEGTHGEGPSFVDPIKLERTDRNALAPGEERAPGPWDADLNRLRATADHATEKEILEGMLKKYRDTAIAPVAARLLAVSQAKA